MVQFVPDEQPSGPLLQGIAAGGFRVDGQVHRAVLLTTSAAMTWQAPEATIAALAPLIAARPELILLGTGAMIRRPGPELARALDEQGIGLEVMDSRAAARAWVILRGEGREVAAGLMALG